MTDDDSHEALVIQRIARHVEASIAREPDPQRRQLLQEFYEDGDYAVQRGSAPGMLLITVGDQDVGEVSQSWLRRPDDPLLN